MVNQGRGRLFRRKDGKFQIYLPKDLCEDSMFPFKEKLKPSPRAGNGGLSMPVDVSFSTKPEGPIALFITPVK